MWNNAATVDRDSDAEQAPGMSAAAHERRLAALDAFLAEYGLLEEEHDRAQALRRVTHLAAEHQQSF